MDTTEVAAPPVEGVEVAPSSQPAEPEAKAPVQTEETGADKVESVENPPQAEPDRRRPSDFVRQRNRIRRLEAEIEAMKTSQKPKEEKKPDSVDYKFDPDAFWQKPDEELTKREKRILSEVETLRQELYALKEGKHWEERSKSEQEAFEIMFPKTSTDIEELWEDRADKNPERAKKLFSILNTPAMKAMIAADPKEAAEFALAKLDKMESKKPDPTLLKKTAMGGTASAGGGGASKMSILQSKMAELKKMSKAAEDETVRNDPKHQERRSTLMKEIEALMEDKK